MLARTWATILSLWFVCSFVSLARSQEPEEPQEPARPDETEGAPSGEMDPASAQAAHAAETQSTVEAMDQEARQHFLIGRTFLDSGRFQQAAEEFEEAYKLSGRPQLLYNLYIAYRDAGNLSKAVESLQEYLDKNPDAPDRINLRARLRSMEEQLEKQAEQEAATKRASEEAARARKQPRTRTVVDHSVVPWIMVGTGGALVASSVVTGVFAKKKSDELDENCFDATACPASQADNIDKAKLLSVTTDVLWAVGGATIITGVVFRVLGTFDEQREVPVASLGVRPGGFSAAVSTRF